MKQLFTFAATVLTVLVFASCCPAQAPNAIPVRSTEGNTKIMLTKGTTSPLVNKDESNALENQTAIKISVKANGNITVFKLNNSPAGRDLYD